MYNTRPRFILRTAAVTAEDLAMTGTATNLNQDVELALARDIVVAYLNQQSVELERIDELVLRVRRALGAPLGGPSGAEPPVTQVEVPQRPALEGGSPAVPIEESITPDYLISLEDGRRFRSLRRHLMAKYGLSPDDYRRKWGLPPDYPMAAPNYASARSAVAKRIGLGKAATASPKGRVREGRK